MLRRAKLDFVILAIVLFGGFAQGGTVTVGPGGGYDFETIQAAIDWALPDETVLVYPGDYGENLILTKNLTLRGVVEPSGNRPRINPSSGIALRIDGGTTLEVSGFIFSDAQTGMVCTSDITADVHHNIFTNIDANGGIPWADSRTGHALYLGGTLTIWNNLFYGNRSTVDTGTVRLRSDNADHLFMNNTLVNNSSSYATIHMGGPNMRIYNNIIANENTGYGIVQWDPYGGWEPDIQYNVIYNCSSGLTDGTVSLSRTINEDPLFVNGVADDYRLTASSPAIDAGMDTGVYGVTDDLVGTVRPYDFPGVDNNGEIAEFDVGAYECAGIVEPNTYHVDVVNGDNSNDGVMRETAFETIQFGIDTAEDGDTLLVWPGVYNESLFFINKGITVQSAADAAELVASGIYAASLYTSEGPESVLKNLVIRDSDTGVYVSSGAPWLEHLTVVNCDLGVEAEAGAEPNIANSILWNNAYDLFQCEAEYSWVEEEMEANLVSYWRFEEGSGTTAYDWVGDNDGTLTNGPVWTAGKVGGALEFDGSNDYVLVAGDASLPYGSTARTVAMWVYTNVSSWDRNAHTPLHYGLGSTRRAFGLDIDYYPNMQFYTWDDDFYFDAGVPLEGWVHVAIIYDGATGIQAYSQGELRGSKTLAAPLDTGFTDIEIGTYLGLGLYFNGRIDEVGIWDRALSAGEIEQLYENGLAGHEYIDPVFADAEGGDYHLKSERGRYWPEHDVWVLDEVSSPCIDAGDARIQPSAEPAANGGRINMGAYGNTAYASMSEWALRGDFDYDGAVGLDDVGTFTDEWLEAVEYLQEPSGSALEFDGVDDYVEVANEGNFDFGSDTDFSVCAWIKTTATINRRRIVNKCESGHTPYTGFSCYMDPPGVVNFRLKDDADVSIATTNSTVNDGSWHFVTGVADRDGYIHIYLDGVLEDTNSLVLVDSINNDISVAIGRSMDYNGQYFDGMIDEVGIYSRALDVNEIGQIYHCGVFDDTNLAGYWGFEEGAGQVAADGSGNSNDGQLGSSPNADSSDPVWVESEVPGVTYHVDGAGGDNDNDGLSRDTAFGSIQFGIDTAEGCDTVMVWPGVYNESLFFINKGITVRSAADAAEIVATGLYAGSFYNFGGGDATLGNFVITDSDTGIYVGSGQPELTNLTVVGNWLGVEAEASAEPNISNCIFWGNDYDLFQCQAKYSLVEEEISMPVAYWKFDEGSGTTAYDSVGGNDGAVYGAQWTTGQVAGALEFDGAGDYVEVPSDDCLEISGALTIGLWMKPNIDIPPTLGYFISLVNKHQGGGGGLGYVLQLDDGTGGNRGALRFVVGTGTSHIRVGDKDSWAAKTWYHVGVSYDPAADAENVKFFVDGQVDASADMNVAIGTHGEPLYIGAEDGTWQYFNGILDEVVIWDRALGPNEVEEVYEDGLAGRGMTLEPLFADANAGDYHLLSERGRYWLAEDVWVLDDVTSPGVDGGDPAVEPSAEPMPNGARANMGAYGGTAYASMSEWPIAGDMDEDGIVNMVDYGILADEWLKALSWATNEPPVVDITSPEDGAMVAYNTIDPVMVEADASDVDGSVVKVEFFANGGKIGQDNDGSDGWDAAWHPESEGAFSLSAMATDDDGATANSPVVDIEVGYVW